MTSDSSGSEYTLMIKNSSLGRELSDEQCSVLAKAVQVRSLEPGEFLFQEGQQDNSIHVVVKGRLEVIRPTGGGDWVTLHLLSEGEMAGALGFIDGLEHSAALRAVTECEVFSLRREDFEALIHTHPDLVYQVMRAIIRSVHGILRRMNIQYVEMTNYISKQHGRY